jgi:GH25 family lysozyme M1 (1,4-beta-N-acetylmuramidase)
MSYILGKDVSQWNNYAPDTEDFVMIKMSGGDAGLYFDSKASVNYTNAKNAGKVVGGYHFAGGGDPIAEATYFLKAMSPVAENDIFALDWEIQHANPVAWAQAFVNEVHSKVGVWPLIYINISTCNAYDWSPVLANCGLWLAAPSYSYNANAPCTSSLRYAARSYCERHRPRCLLRHQRTTASLRASRLNTSSDAGSEPSYPNGTGSHPT